jgi:hypothetical protein
MTQARTADELYASIVESRGGADALSAEEHRIANCLVAALAKSPSEMDAHLIERLLSLLPDPIRKPHAVHTITVHYEDSDGDGHAYVPGGPSGALENAKREIEDWKSRFFALVKSSGVPPRPVVDPPQERQEPQEPPEQQAAPEPPSNVLNFDPRGNGSAEVNGSLSERYPSLRWDPPVGRW